MDNEKPKLNNGTMFHNGKLILENRKPILVAEKPTVDIDNNIDIEITLAIAIEIE